VSADAGEADALVTDEPVSVSDNGRVFVNFPK